MKVISLLQPWASLVVFGHKKIETRSWNTKHRGELLIHASAKNFHNKYFNLYKEWLSKGYVQLMYEQFSVNGAIIGKVNLINTCLFDKETPPRNITHINEDKVGIRWDLTDKELAFGDYSPGRYGWLLSDPVIFEHPIPAKGQLGLWNYDLNLKP